MSIKVNHANYGVLFAAMINGYGSLITQFDDEGDNLPFLTTDEILKQLMKFGFYITYDVKKNLPSETFDFLAQVFDLGFDKITRVALESINESGSKVWRPKIIVMKSEQNTDLLVFDCKITKKVFNQKLEANSIMNVTDTDDIQWDWLTYIANISDILQENVGCHHNIDNLGLTEYNPEEAEDGE